MAIHWAHSKMPVTRVGQIVIWPPGLDKKFAQNNEKLQNKRCRWRNGRELRRFKNLHSTYNMCGNNSPNTSSTVYGSRNNKHLFLNDKDNNTNNTNMR